MKILAIETSCDETAIAILETSGSQKNPVFNLLSNVVLSQIKIHKPFGGVVPNLAKREHQKNLVPILITALRDAKMLQSRKLKLSIISDGKKNKLTPFRTLLSLRRRGVGGEVNSSSASILNREPYLQGEVENFFKKYEAPDIDAIAVTYGPGLEPALWVGINFARALAAVWKKPLIPVNHLEGHIYASWLRRTNIENKKEVGAPTETSELPKFPLLALIVSGGHTELVLMKNHLHYKVLGETRDDAVGEAFDKVAKMLGLEYPGGPEISKLAEKGNPKAIEFPRPMINSPDFDFSFSGLKTAVLYHLRDSVDKRGLYADQRRKNQTQNKNFADKNSRRGRAVRHLQSLPLTNGVKEFLDAKFLFNVAASFEQAAIDVLVAKTAKALKKYKVKSLVAGGGVAANKKLRHSIEILIKKIYTNISLHLSPLWLTGDNAAMIAVAAYFHSVRKKKVNVSSAHWRTLRAHGHLPLQ